MNPTESNDMESSDIEEFWNKTRSSANSSSESGYLSDGWPVELATARFAGEWKWVRSAVLPLVKSHGRVLDIGCGTGLWLEHLAPLFSDAEGIDISQSMIDSAGPRLQRAGIDNVSLRVAKVEELETTQTYDLIFVGGVLLYLKDDQIGDALAKIRQLLTPDGIIVFREGTYRKQTYYRDKPLAPGLFKSSHRATPIRYQAIYRTIPILRNLLAGAGLTVLRQRANPDYKYADMKKSQLRLVNKFLSGKLESDEKRASHWARRIQRVGFMTHVPVYYFCRLFRIPAWNIGNYWFVCKPSKSVSQPRLPH